MDTKDGQSSPPPHRKQAEGSTAALKVEWRKSLIEKRQALADRLVVLEHGRIVEKFGASELEEKMPVLTELLGV